MKIQHTETFRFDDLHSSEQSNAKTIAEAVLCVANHDGDLRYVPGKAQISEKGAYYVSPEDWPKYVVTWEEEVPCEEEASEDEFPDCDSNCVGCDRACADRILTSESQEDEEEEQEYEVTIEHTYRVAKKFKAKPSEVERMAENLADNIGKEIFDGDFQIDYALCDAEGKTIIDWN